MTISLPHARSRRTAWLALPLAILGLGGCKQHASNPVVAQAWVRLPAIPGQPAAAYFTLIGGRSGDRLIQAESAMAQRIELHESMTGMSGMAGMKPLAGVDLPAGGTIAFAPGGKHAMVYGVDPVVKPGTAIPLRFGFASGKTAEAEAKTVAAGDDAPY
jgi:copper(I)-binding protein